MENSKKGHILYCISVGVAIREVVDNLSFVEIKCQPDATI